MKWTELEPKTTALKSALLNIIEAIKTNGAENLPKVEPTLDLSLDLLKKPSYDIVVCGEVKKGKSTFINAIVGQEILPVNTQVATSQVFRITNSETESFELVFTDGATQKITKEELSRYGCQVDANLLGETQFTDKVLDYIQVNIPVEFLPKGVTVVDTPGLGALYEAHEQITNRYVANAAAVLFVFDPANPMVKQEQEFLNKVFAITPYVMFIMTKIDNYSEEYIVNMIRRNEDLLQKDYADKCYASPKVFPVASVTLASATAENDDTLKEAYYNSSLFPAAKEELLRLIYKTVGLSRNTFAFSEAGKQVQKTCSSIKEQITMVAGESEQEKEAIKQKRTELSDWFNKTWGPASTTRTDIRKKIDEIGTGVQNRTQKIVSPHGKLFKRYADEIAGLTSKEQAETFANALPERIKSDVASAWQEILTTAQNKFKELLGEYQFKMDQMLNQKSSSDVIPLSSPVELNTLSGRDKFNCFKQSYIDAGITVGIGATLLAVVGIAFGPILGVIATLGVIIWGWFGGDNTAREQELRNIKAKLNNGLTSAFSQIRENLLIVPIKGENYSPVQKFVLNIKEMGETTLKSIYESKQKDLKLEDARLEQQHKMEFAQKQQEYAKLKQQQQVWNQTGLDLQKSQVLLHEIIESLKEYGLSEL
ncbi:MAG: dynamin family protein [Prevotella sp.]|jgi:GTPase Era involved in 16S rRNA processing|nr:dynamin family protein [Prevotella sp.]